MDVWIVINPILKVTLYFSSFGSVGGYLFSLYFREHLAEQQLLYCLRLSRKSALIGTITSLLLFFSVAGNLGGDIISVIDLFMLQLAVESKAGISYLASFAGFVVMLIAYKLMAKTQTAILFIGSIAVLFSFTLSGHALLDGILTQLLLMVHLFGISFWLGALLPFHWICLKSDTSNLSSLAHRFGVIAIVHVGLLLIAGMAYAYLLLGDLTLIFKTSYGNVLLTKIVLVSFLLSLAALNKFKLVPMLEKSPIQGVRQFKYSVQFEIITAFLILIATSILDTSLTPPLGM